MNLRRGRRAPDRVIRSRRSRLSARAQFVRSPRTSSQALPLVDIQDEATPFPIRHGCMAL